MATAGVVMFVAVLILLILILVGLWILFSRDLPTAPVLIMSKGTGLFLTVRVITAASGIQTHVLTADGQEGDAFSSWNLIPDEEGQGAFTIRNAYSGRFLSYVARSDGTTSMIMVDDSVIAQPSVNPVGWFFIESPTRGVNSFETFATAGVFYTAVPLTSTEEFAFVTLTVTTPSAVNEFVFIRPTL